MEAEYDEDMRLLDRLTRMKLNIISKRLKSPHASRSHRRRSYSPESVPETPPLFGKKNNSLFHSKFDRRNEILQKLWEELDEGNKECRRKHPVYLPSIKNEQTHVRRKDHIPTPLVEAKDKSAKNTKNDLLEMMLIQNAHMQQWLVFQTLQRSDKNQTEIHNHYYESTGKPFSPNSRSNVGSQYPQDFFDNQPDKDGSSENEESVDRQESPTKRKKEKKRR